MADFFVATVKLPLDHDFLAQHKQYVLYENLSNRINEMVKSHGGTVDYTVKDIRGPKAKKVVEVCGVVSETASDASFVAAA